MRNAAGLCVLVVVGMLGCAERVPVAIALRPPPPDVPTSNIPREVRQQNWRGSKGEGSCVYASTVNVLRGQNLFDLAEWIRRNCGNGATQYDIIRVLESRGLRKGENFDCTFNADAEFLDWADRNGQGAIVWWKPGHCCSFHGWVTKPDGQVYAVILDNNRTEDFELTERRQFLSLWAGYGGFGLSPMYDAGTIVPYQSYRLIYE